MTDGHRPGRGRPRPAAALHRSGCSGKGLELAQPHLLQRRCAPGVRAALAARRARCAFSSAVGVGQVAGLEDEADVRRRSGQPSQPGGGIVGDGEARSASGCSLIDSRWSSLPEDHQRRQLLELSVRPRPSAPRLAPLSSLTTSRRLHHDVGGRRNAGRDQSGGSVCAHRLNTTAGSMRMTLPMADSAEMAHMATVSASSKAASPGVMTMGSAVCSLR